MKTFGRPKTAVERSCPICNAMFEALPSEIARGAGRYRSLICSDEAKRRRVTAEASPEAPRTPSIERTCETCLATFLVYPYRSNSGAAGGSVSFRRTSPGGMNREECESRNFLSPLPGRIAGPMTESVEVRKCVNASLNLP